MVTAVTGLVERDEELSILRSAFVAPSGHVVLVEGEAGSGKTELLRAALADARDRRDGATVFFGTCEALEIPTAFAPLYEMLRHLPGGIVSMITGGAEPLAVYAAVLDLLRSQPIVLVIDDVHWADAATIGLLRYVGRRVVDTPSTLLLALRTDELDESGDVSALIAELGRTATRLVLEPLTADGVRVLADDPSVDASALWSTSGGNPFFVVELLREPDVDVPRTVGEVITARLRRLPLGAQRLVEGISLCPDGLPIDVALRLSVDANDHIDHGCNLGLLMIDRDRVRCRHDIVRTSTERAIAPVRRRELHAQLLALLEPLASGPADIARLAEHAAGCGDGLKTAEYSVRAALDAQRAGTHRQAADHFIRVLEFEAFIPPARLDDVLRRASDEFELVGDPERALTTARLRLRHASDVPTRADALAQLGSCTLSTGDCEGAQRFAMESLSLDVPDDAPCRAVASRLLARVVSGDGDWNVAADQATRALEAARAVGSTELVARALVTAGTAYSELGQERGFDMLREAFELASADELHDAAAHAINNLASSLNWERRVDEARQAFISGIDFCVARELDSWAVSLRGALAMTEVRGGRWAEARRQLLAADGPAHCWGGNAEAMFVATLIEMRSNGALRSDADVLLEALERSGDSWGRLDGATFAGEAAWHGVVEPQVARERYDRLLDDPAFLTDPWGCAQVLFWSTRLGFALPTIHPTPLPAPIALEIAGDLVGAAEAWKRLGCPFERALVCAGMADPPVAEITSALTELGALFSLEIVHRDLRRRGFDIATTPAREHPSGLTPRQLDVLALLDDGLSNADISDRLFISEKTAGHHVSAILTAFGVPSRGAAVAHARDNAWL